MNIPVHNLQGDVVGEVELQDGLFDVPFRHAVVHQAVTSLLANKRQGNAATKTRGDVVGSTRKLFAQKGTGRARRGSVKSPVLRGGGVAFGPHPRSYRKKMPRKMRQLAFRCALSEKMREGSIWAVEEWGGDVPRTKDVVMLLSSAGQPRSALIVTEESSPIITLSARNVTGTTVRECAVMSTLDVMKSEKVIATVPALRKMEALWGVKGSGDESA